MKRNFYKKLKLIQTVFAAIGLVLLWRGVWGLCDIYLFPDHPEASYIFSALFGLFILFIDDFEFKELGFGND